MSGEVEIIVGPLRGPTCTTYIRDFANMLKAFIGSNYLTIGFAFHQSGLGLGLIGTILIASLTAHCCNLIVKCKYSVIQLVMQAERDRGDTQKSRKPSYGSESPSSSSSEEGSEEVHLQDGTCEAPKTLLQGLNYGDVGRFCFGRLGVAMVNIPVVITQFGFCVGYCIFIGNTIQNMFPMYNCSVPIDNSTTSQIEDKQRCYVVNGVGSPQTGPRSVYNLTAGPEELLHSAAAGLSPFPSLLSSQSGVGDWASYWLLGNSSSTTTMTEVSNVTTTTLAPNLTTATSLAPNLTTATSLAPNLTTVITLAPNLTTATTLAPNLTTATTLGPNLTTSTVNTTTAGIIPWSNITVWTLTRGAHVPDLRLLVLVPVPLFVVTAMIRSLRHMGWLSMMANFAILLGCAEVLYFLISGFFVSDTFRWINVRGIAIFFGLVTSSFEGIGTILPIEGSMEGNRHNFTKYLYGAIAVLAFILVSFGTLGYLHFGNKIDQMVNANIPSGDTLNIFVNVSLCIGVLLTFPLMLFPVVELAELFFFGTGCLCKPGEDEDEESENQLILPKEEGVESSSHSSGIPRNVATWKRNLLRVVIVLCAGGLAVLLRNYFAYISAFVGALGSTMLAYILPCLFHLRLRWNHLSLFTKVKDITIVVIGISLGIAGMYSVVSEIIG
ncbi:hypothetical protein ACOMHN_000214 [Nucella lapillus]